MVLKGFAAILWLALMVSGCQTGRTSPAITQLPVSLELSGSTLQPNPTIAPTRTLQINSTVPGQTYPPTPTRARTSTPFLTTSTPVVLGVLGFPSDVNPLTGLNVVDPKLMERRPVMVKVSNYPRYGRPHAGLSFADLVFEYYIGGFENRFSALYYSQDSKTIGPLRSGRMVDSDLAKQYGAVLVYGNADPRVDKVLVDTLGPLAVTIDDAPCPPICGTDTHSETGVFVDSSAMTNYMDGKGINNSRPNLTGMVFDARPPTSTEIAVQLGVMFGPQDRGEWRYDPDSGKYLRWIEEIRPGNKLVMVPLVDRLTNKQLAFNNIIILYATYVEHLPTLHEILISKNDSSNRAVYFRDGMILEGLWKVRSADQPIYLMNRYGLPMALKPGPTWFIIVGQSSDLLNPNNGYWELEFHTK
jgi:hypothetical protein